MTSSCEHPRQASAAYCAGCLRDLYGYGTGKLKSTGRLVEPVKTITHLPKFSTPTSAQQSQHAPQSVEARLKLELAVLTERLGLVERTFESYQQTPLDTVPEDFRDLQVFTGGGKITPLTTALLEVKPQNAEGGMPRYCAIHAHDEGYPNNRVHLQFGGVHIGQCPQMQFADRTCERFVSTRFYDLQYGAPVKWAAISYCANQCAVFYLKNPHASVAEVNIEVWCDVDEYFKQKYQPTPGNFYRL